MWKICTDKPYQNIEKIFPTQQRDVGKIVDAWKNDENVLKIVIFGSSVTAACNPWSDIDVFVELKEKKRRAATGAENPVDIWSNFDVDDFLLNEIMKTGVTVYERRAVSF